MKRLTFLLTILSAPALAQVSPDTLATKQLDEVVITGQYQAQSVRKSVYQVRIIDREIIQLRNPTNIQNLLNTEVGVRFTQDPATGTSDISLMGMTGQNVKILLDGVPLLDRGTVRESLNQIDINSIERIEIVEGPMSVVYGTDALAGVINIITKKGSGETSRLSVNARVLEESAGSEYTPIRNQGTHLESTSVNWQNSHWNADGGFTRNIFGGYRINEPVRWLPKDQYLGNGSFGYKNDVMSAWYRLNYAFENILYPGTPSNNAVVNKEYITNRYTHQAQGDWRASDRLTFTGIASYQDYTRRTRTTRIDLVTGDKRLTTDAGSQDISKFSSEMMRMTSVYRQSSKLSLQTGFELNMNTGSGDRIEGTKSINDLGVFATTEWEVTKNLSLRPGVRFLYNSAYKAPPAVPSFNAKLKINDRVDVRLAYARGFRAPSLRELYFYFFDASHSIKGNTNLKAEHSNSFTGSLSWMALDANSYKLKTTLGTFYNQFENMIDLALDPTDQTGQLYTYQNIYKYRTQGFTLANMMYWKTLQVNFGGSYIGSYNIFSESQANLPQVLWTPEVNTTIMYRFDRIGTSVSLFYKYTGVRSRYATLFNEQTGQEEVQLVKVAQFQWADLTFTKELGKYVTLTTGIKNLFDIKNVASNAQASTHTAGGSVPTGYGRTYFLGLNFQWTKD